MTAALRLELKYVTCVGHGPFDNTPRSYSYDLDRPRTSKNFHFDVRILVPDSRHLQKLF